MKGSFQSGLALLVAAACWASYADCQGSIGAEQLMMNSGQPRGEALNSSGFYLDLSNPADCSGMLYNFSFCFFGAEETGNHSTFTASIALYKPTGIPNIYTRVSQIYQLSKSRQEVATNFSCDVMTLDNPIFVEIGSVFGACQLGPPANSMYSVLNVVGMITSTSPRLFRYNDNSDIAGCANNETPSLTSDDFVPLKAQLYVSADIECNDAQATTDVDDFTDGSNSTDFLDEEEPEVRLIVPMAVGWFFFLLSAICCFCSCIMFRKRKETVVVSNRDLQTNDYFHMNPPRPPEPWEQPWKVRKPEPKFAETPVTEVQEERLPIPMPKMKGPKPPPRPPSLAAMMHNYSEIPELPQSPPAIPARRRIPQPPAHFYQNMENSFTEPPPLKKEDEFVEPAEEEDDIYIQLQAWGLPSISRNELQNVNQIGSGQFVSLETNVWRKSGEKPVEVFLKGLKEGTTAEEKIQFLQEAAILAQFNHNNVIRAFGMTSRVGGGPLYLIFELCHIGDLKKYLVTTQPLPEESVPELFSRVLLSFSQQIAMGMKYLASKGFVHRDLAARNVLLTKEFVCKIAEFGLSRNLADDKYYLSRGGKIPIKWTAPEAIHYKKYSTASDVWSYGCLLYEIWSLGHKPFEGLDNIQVLKVVDSGTRLSPPPGCPKIIYKLMIECWNPEKDERPEFREIEVTLKGNIETILDIPVEDSRTHPLATRLGGPLEAGHKMYIQLRKKYQ